MSGCAWQPVPSWSASCSTERGDSRAPKRIVARWFCVDLNASTFSKWSEQDIRPESLRQSRSQPAHSIPGHPARHVFAKFPGLEPGRDGAKEGTLHDLGVHSLHGAESVCSARDQSTRNRRCVDGGQTAPAASASGHGSWRSRPDPDQSAASLWFGTSILPA